MSSDLHFQSQAKADEYLLERQITSHKQNPRVTRSRARQLTVLEQQRAALQAPVYTLPDEVLAEIFKTGAVVGEGDNNDIVDLQFSYSVSWVVSRWRRVALNTPALWTSFGMGLPIETSMEYERCTALLARASSRLLDLAVDLLPSYMGNNSLRYTPRKLDDILSRCKSIILTSGDPAWNCVVPIAQPTPTYPGVVDLYLSNMGFSTLAAFLDLLQALPSLVSLTIGWIEIAQLDPLENRDVQLDQLKRLDVHIALGSLEGMLAPVLRLFNAPQVTELALNDWDGVMVDYLDCSRVSTLTVSGLMQLLQAEVISLISSMPELKQLKLDVIIGDPIAEVPSTVATLGLVEIDFTNSAYVDRLARCLVEQSGSSLRKVSFSIPRFGIPPMSSITQNWIRGRGVQIVWVQRDESDSEDDGIDDDDDEDYW